MASVFDGVPALQHFSITPALNAYLAGTQERRTQETHTAGLTQNAIETLGRLAVSADTPERWGMYVDSVQQRFPGVDLSNYRDFTMRGTALAEFEPHFQDREEAQRLFGQALAGGRQQQPTPQAPRPTIQVPNTTPSVAPQMGVDSTDPDSAPHAPPPPRSVAVPSIRLSQTAIAAGLDVKSVSEGLDDLRTGKVTLQDLEAELRSSGLTWSDLGLSGPPTPARGPLVNAQGQPYRGPGAVSIPVDFRLTNDTMQGMTPNAMAMLGAAQQAANGLGIRLEVVGANDPDGGSHASHNHGTEFDIVGYHADGSRWTPAERVQVANAARGSGGNRFGFYPSGSMHMGVGAPGLPQNVAWGPGGQTSGVPVSAFAPEEQGFVSALRGGVPFEQVAQAGQQMGVSPQLADLYSVLGSPGFDQLSATQQAFVVSEIDRLQATPEPQAAPSGYRWLPNGNLEAIPGGPAAQGAAGSAPPSGYRWTANGDLEVIPGGPEDQPVEPEGPNVEGEGALRREFNQITGGFRDVYDSYQRVEASAADPSAAGDLALIFNYMKILDPGSAVRETEFANAQNAAAVPEIVRAQWNRVFSGERLSEVQRADFLDRARRLYEAKHTDYAARANDYRNLATQYGYDPNRIVPERDFSPTYDRDTETTTPPPVSPPPTNTSVLPRQPATPAAPTAPPGPPINPNAAQPAPFVPPASRAAPTRLPTPAQPATPAPATPQPSAAPRPFAAIEPARQGALRAMATELTRMGLPPERIIEEMARRGYIVTAQDLGL